MAWTARPATRRRLLPEPAPHGAMPHARVAVAPAARDPAAHGYRPFLDGLRALAVLSVLAYHLDRPWLPGGFLGVDLFFVLSGYLITSLLLAEHARTGRIDLPAFWSRRIRRLLPALLVVLVAMAVVIQLRGDVLAQGAARGDLIATLFYVANWHFITSGQSYFSQYLAVSPDRHTWSLAIEEQFYLAWPLVVSGVLAWSTRRRLAVVAATAAVASAVLMSLLFDGADPSRVYYGTDTRIFEILVGALGAMILASTVRDRIAPLARRLAWPALLMVLAAFVLLADDDAAYYHGAALGLAIIVTTLIVGLESGSGLARVLSVRPLVAVGLVSYGLYLWHFPVITFIGQAIGPTSSPPIAVLAVAITLAATYASFRIVETPIRRGGRLLRYRLTPRRLVGVVPIASGAVAAVIVATTSTGVAAPDWSALDASTVGTPPAAVAGSTLVPAVAVTTPAPAASRDAGASPGTRAVAIRTIGVVGDSVISSALAGLRAEASARGLTLVAASVPGCAIGHQPLFDDLGRPSSFNDRCRTVPALHAELLAARPQVVIWEDLQSVLARRAPDGTFLAAGSAAWTADLLADWTARLDELLAVGADVVIVMPPLRSQQAAGCRDVAMESRCLDLQRQDAIVRRATTAFWKSVQDRRGVHLVDVDGLLCPAGVPCPTRIDGIAVRISGWDQTHFTPQGAAWFAPRLLDLVARAVAGDE